MSEITTRVDHTAKAFDTDLQEITRKVAEMGAAGAARSPIFFFCNAAVSVLLRSGRRARRPRTSRPQPDTGRLASLARHAGY